MAGRYERRLAPRVPCAFDIEDVSGVATTACRATNVSESGVYLRTRGGVLLEGERVALALHLPDERDPLWIGGQVVEQVQEPLHDGAAVRFDALSAADRGRLRAYVQHARGRQLSRALAGLGAAVAG